MQIPPHLPIYWLVVKEDHAGLLPRNSWCESMQASQIQCSSIAERPPDKRKTLGQYQALEPFNGCLAHAGERRSEEPESRVQLPDSCQTARKH